MCNRAEQFARKLYTPWSEDGMSRKDNTEVIEACIKGYEQAEKDTIERVCDWLESHLPIIVNYYDEDIHEDAYRAEFIDLFRTQMDDEKSNQ